MNTRFGVFGLPPDAVGAIALGAGLLWGGVLLTRARSPIDGLSTRAIAIACGLAAAVLSIGHLHHYLGGGPRIIDATSYLLEAASFAQGHFTLGVEGPVGSFNGRFLLLTPEGKLGVIFPPGYPLALAFATKLGAPLALGPVLGFGLVVATHELAASLACDRRERIGAVALSTLSATLRFHTSDTMAHALCALLLATGVIAARRTSDRSALLAGLTVGWLCATRPATGLLAIGLVSVAMGPTRRLPIALVACIPGFALLVAHQFTLTGHLFESSQTTYYARSDTPPDCFRYGLGNTIGCRFEHSDFVERHLPNGYGVREALGTTFRRLVQHLRDAGNTELFVIPLLASLPLVARRAPLALGVAALAGIAAVYAPFYFDGNIPAGGARMFVDALPFEQILVAVGAVRLGVGRFIAPLALLGFSMHTVHDHVGLARRHYGKPMFEPAVVRDAGVERGLILMDTDHGFNLGAAYAAQRPGLVIARRRDDAHDVALRTALGEPDTWHYLLREDTPSELQRVPKGASASTLLRATSLWPALEVKGGSAAPAASSAPCAEVGRGLNLLPAAGGRAEVKRLQVALVLPPTPGGTVRLVWSVPTGASRTIRVTLGEAFAEHALDPAPGQCFETDLDATDASAMGVLRLEISGGPLVLHHVVFDH